MQYVEPIAFSGAPLSAAHDRHDASPLSLVYSPGPHGSHTASEVALHADSVYSPGWHTEQRTAYDWPAAGWYSSPSKQGVHSSWPADAENVPDSQGSWLLRRPPLPTTTWWPALTVEHSDAPVGAYFPAATHLVLMPPLHAYPAPQPMHTASEVALHADSIKLPGLHAEQGVGIREPRGQ